MKLHQFFKVVGFVCIASLLSHCSGASKFQISGTIQGTTEVFVLELNGTEELEVQGTEFMFLTELEDGDDFEVLVVDQPTGHFCVVSNGDGTVNGQDVTNIIVTCATN